MTRAERFWAKVQKTENCWLWTGATAGSKRRYGYFKVGGRKNVYAHRYSYELHYGPIPDGMQVDHVVERGCTSVLCVNPAHLEAVTKGENLKRRTTVDKPACKYGHEFTEENTWIDEHGWRWCRKCHARREKERRARVHVE